MRCRTARTWIVAARDGELGARQRRALDRHLGQCAACRAERVSVEGVLAALDGLSMETDVPARLEADVLRQVRGLAANSSDALPWLRRMAPAVTATAVVGLAVLGIRSGAIAPTDAHRPHAAAPVVAKVAPARDAAATRETASAPNIAAAPERPALARRAKTRVPDEPPAELASRPDLFVDLPMLRDLDKLQHFDAIATMGDIDAAPAEAPPSNG